MKCCPGTGGCSDESCSDHLQCACADKGIVCVSELCACKNTEICKNRPTEKPYYPKASARQSDITVSVTLQGRISHLILAFRNTWGEVISQEELDFRSIVYDQTC